MYCLIQFYVQLKHDLAEHGPLVKVAAIKLVIFLSFWQNILISFLTSTGAIKASGRFQDPDIRIGIPALLLCIEMAIFSVFHLFAFPWQVYDIRRSAIVASESAPGFLPDPKTAYLGGPLGTRALLDAFNPWDLVKAVGRGFRWFAVGRRTREQDISYQAHKISRPVNSDFSHSDIPREANSIPSGSFTPGINSKQGRYHQLKGGGAEDDDRRLLSHQQAVPLSDSANIYPRPGMRLPDDMDIAQGLYDGGSSLHSTNSNQQQHMPYSNHMRQPPYPDQNHQGPGILDPAMQPSHPSPLPYADQDTTYHGAAPSIPHPLPSASSHHLRPTSNASTTSTRSDPDDWSAWSGAHGPHNQSDVARLSAEHIDRARLSAEQEIRSRRASEESGSSRLEAEERRRERDRGPSPSEIWGGLQGSGGKRVGD
ncbi:MAG: hypothetical protein Q9220_000302 [cf. Caloplaca sp. 1 TL-2023]